MEARVGARARATTEHRETGTDTGIRSAGKGRCARVRVRPLLLGISQQQHLGPGRIQKGGPRVRVRVRVVQKGGPRVMVRVRVVQKGRPSPGQGSGYVQG